jgi:hypothetical protein
MTSDIGDLTRFEPLGLRMRARHVTVSERPPAEIDKTARLT